MWFLSLNNLDFEFDIFDKLFDHLTASEIELLMQSAPPLQRLSLHGLVGVSWGILDTINENQTNLEDLHIYVDFSDKPANDKILFNNLRKFSIENDDSLHNHTIKSSTFPLQFKRLTEFSVFDQMSFENWITFVVQCKELRKLHFLMTHQISYGDVFTLVRELPELTEVTLYETTQV